MIIVGGMIGLGKSSVCKLLGEHFKTEVFYESVEDNPILPLFYTASDEEIKKKRYPFLLQLYFLNDKISSIKKAVNQKNTILDRSIYEDWYFAKVNRDLDRISELEYGIYEKLLKNMLDNSIRNKDNRENRTELMIYLKGSFETVIDRILKRGRSYEMDEHLKTYYRKIWEGYDDWIMQYYDEKKILILDMDQIDIISSEEDAKMIIQLVENRLHDMTK